MQKDPLFTLIILFVDTRLHSKDKSPQVFPKLGFQILFQILLCKWNRLPLQPLGAPLCQRQLVCCKMFASATPGKLNQISQAGLCKNGSFQVKPARKSPLKDGSFLSYHGCVQKTTGFCSLRHCIQTRMFFN